MRFWGFYFLAKLYLYIRGFIQFDFIINFIFLLFLALPIPKKLKINKFVVAGRQFLNVTFGLLLLWRDSWLPSLTNSAALIEDFGVPAKEYIFRFVLGYINIREISILGVLAVLCFVAGKHIRLTPVVAVLLLLVPLHQIVQHPEGIAESLDAFYQSESSRTIRFDNTNMKDANFDIVLLHVCSLSWDDLEEAGIGGHSFFKQFDILLTNFNSVTAYTNPAAIRLLRANCGQPKHSALYHDAPDDCYLLDSLRDQGYRTYTAMNHSVSESNFAEQITSLGRADPPIEPTDVPVQAYNYDDSPIFDDFLLLESWWKLRQTSNPTQAALYYDTTSLHGGAHWVDDQTWWKRDRVDLYREFAQNLFNDMERFFELIESSGRNAVIVFVPEHGMALRGNALQAPDLRDIPFPQITLVPVGIKFIGEPFNLSGVDPVIISKPTSYLSLSYLLASFHWSQRDPVPRTRDSTRAGSRARGQ